MGKSRTVGEFSDSTAPIAVGCIGSTRHSRHGNPLKKAPVAEPPREYFDIAQAANYLAVHVYALRRAVWAKQLICAKIGHKLIFAKADLDRWFGELRAANA